MDDDGNLASFSRAPGTVNRPFDRDGARAVAALVAQTRRLYEQRSTYRSKLRSTGQHIEHMQVGAAAGRRVTA